jgi:hypothetical protein
MAGSLDDAQDDRDCGATDKTDDEGVEEPFAGGHKALSKVLGGKEAGATLTRGNATLK